MKEDKKKKKDIKQKHAWFTYRDDKFRSCRRCGYIENSKNTNADCDGPRKLSLRSE